MLVCNGGAHCVEVYAVVSVVWFKSNISHYYIYMYTSPFHTCIYMYTSPFHTCIYMYTSPFHTAESDESEFETASEGEEEDSQERKKKKSKRTKEEKSLKQPDDGAKMVEASKECVASETPDVSATTLKLHFAINEV